MEKSDLNYLFNLMTILCEAKNREVLNNRSTNRDTLFISKIQEFCSATIPRDLVFAETHDLWNLARFISRLERISTLELIYSRLESLTPAAENNEIVKTLMLEISMEICRNSRSSFLPFEEQTDPSLYDELLSGPDIPNLKKVQEIISKHNKILESELETPLKELDKRPDMFAERILNVQPMSAPTGQLFTLDFVYADETPGS